MFASARALVRESRSVIGRFPSRLQSRELHRRTPAALAAAERCAPRAVPIAELQAALRRQQVLLRAGVEPALAPAGATASKQPHTLDEH